MRLLREAVIAAQRVAGLNAHEGEAPVDTSGKVVTQELPLTVYFPMPGVPESEDLCATLTKRVDGFQITYEGATVEQAEWVGEKVRDLFDFQFLTVAGQPVHCIPTDSQPVQRDDNNTRTGGGALYVGLFRYDTHFPH